MPGQKPSYSVPALEKAFDVIELLAGESDPLTLSAIAEALDRSPSEIFRVLRTLEERGYLARDPGDRYLLTNRLFEHGLRRPAIASLLEIAYPEMRALAAAVGHSCHISVLSGGRMVTVARVEQPSAASFVVPIGFSVPVVESASGRVLLAFLPSLEQETWLATLPNVDRAGLARILSRIRARGYEIAPSASVVGITDLSFPLFEADARPVACLAVPLAARRHDRPALRAVIKLVRAAAERIDSGFARLRHPARPATARGRPSKQASNRPG
ncbi:MAG TPA: IclR family transcriptional regulator [Alphaproteobacteria bacterium]|nr:IclR family transcriptional regulator [Alphaproteobacteria bacterium]